ncbi:hypothetical protein DPMN_051009 [Dreissena polymorpha]|uniref:Uncharacterized protein n=1 Tax=Dreissena polymorpha TaxID=45954 RepID=A0A9D4CIB3_DREPO|nr:hypothetical protein DPMN_051009 [Dreissena polymorpha]
MHPNGVMSNLARCPPNCSSEGLDGDPPQACFEEQSCIESRAWWRAKQSQLSSFDGSR